MEIGDRTNINFPGYIQIGEHLFSTGQMLCGQTHGVADRLCQEVAKTPRHMMLERGAHSNWAKKWTIPS